MRSVFLHLAASIVTACVAVLSCSSSKPGPSPTTATEEVTFASTIQPLMEEKCQGCHRDGGIAPFALVTYDDVANVASAARSAIESRVMPPWGPFPDPTCSVSRPFKNDLSLTDEQIALFGEWVEHGLPRGEVSKSPPPSTHSAMSPVGLAAKTDAFESGADYIVKGKAADEIRCFPIDPGFTEDAWVAESIVIPGDPKVVHHALVYVDADQEGVNLAGSEGSYPCFGGPELKQNSLILAWSPGGTTTTYGDGAALKIPKGAHIVMQVHYHPVQSDATGRMSVELRRLSAPPQRIAKFMLVGNAASKDDPVKLLPGPDDPESGPAFIIPANAKNHTETMEFELPQEQTRLSAIGAHMHWAGVAMKVEVVRKSPRQPADECLLSTKYDFNWQRTFAYDTPLADLPLLRAGDKVRITCTYDNTMDNPRIAQAMSDLRRKSPMDIRLGGKSTDEMCQAILVFVED